MKAVYEHNLFEGEIYKKWEISNSFAPSTRTDAKPFCIIMPPPNANDPLHTGHAMFLTIEDIFVRFHRMKGDAVLWLPGTDHAGIETQFVFEKKLAKMGKSRFDYDRETLYKLIWDYVADNSGIAVEQMKKLGSSADWERFKFTLDPQVVEFVLSTFVALAKDDLVYRGERLVNYCPKCGTGYSELEIEYEERKDSLYFMKYGPFTIATTRPETKFRDTALAVNPKDKRYKQYIGKTVEIMGLLGQVKMTVIPDTEVDPKFGTGIMKVTPAHDQHDFELGQKFNLEVNPIITPEGRMDFRWFLESKDFVNQEEKYRQRAQKYHGMKVGEARKLMVEHLKEDGLMEREDTEYVHRVATCYRCHGVIEPLPIPQFFIKTSQLTQSALKALDKKETKILGIGREKILRHWLKNLRDWNISRQIVWGIRIPVWYKISDNPEIRVTFKTNTGEVVKGRLGDLVTRYGEDEIVFGLQQIVAPISAKYTISTQAPGPSYIQETDTFDTWFSSGQWPVVTLKTAKDGDFEKWYPTSIMETGYDILPIWVMRMMILGIYLTGKSPFEWVYLHGLIRDEQGRKMSKSLGNVLNPIDMVEKYGADALRMALVVASTPGQDKSVGESSIRGMRNFSNKIWNASRWIIDHSPTLDFKTGKGDKEMENKLKVIKEKITKLLDSLKPGQAAELLYKEFWHWYCDVAIEEAKKGLIGHDQMVKGLELFLKWLHPFMPFVTEAVYQELRIKNNELKDEMLISSSWPH